MANITTTVATPFLPQIWAMEALNVLRANITIAHICARDTDYDPGWRGKVLNIPYPGTFTAQSKVEGNMVGLQTPANAATVQVTLSRHETVDFILPACMVYPVFVLPCKNTSTRFCKDCKHFLQQHAVFFKKSAAKAARGAKSKGSMTCRTALPARRKTLFEQRFSLDKQAFSMPYCFCIVPTAIACRRQQVASQRNAEAQYPARVPAEVSRS